MTRKMLATALSLGILGTTTAGVVAMTRPSSDLSQIKTIPLATKADEVREAIDHLKKAESLLAKADHDETGDDYQAYKLTKQAIEHCDAFLKNRKGQ